jgi:hypothetical protein
MVQEATSLKGRTVAVTRPTGQAEEAGEMIAKRGGKPYLIPTIEIKGPRDLSATKKFIEALARDEVDYVIFMSINGVPAQCRRKFGTGQATQRVLEKDCNCSCWSENCSRAYKKPNPRGLDPGKVHFGRDNRELAAAACFWQVNLDS